MYAIRSYYVYLVDEICELGETKVYPRFDKLPDFKNLIADDCYVFWDIFLATDLGINAISEVFIFADDQCELVVRKISEINLLEEPSFLVITSYSIHYTKLYDFKVCSCKSESSYFLHKYSRERLFERAGW